MKIILIAIIASCYAAPGYEKSKNNLHLKPKMTTNVHLKSKNNLHLKPKMTIMMLLPMPVPMHSTISNLPIEDMSNLPIEDMRSLSTKDMSNLPNEDMNKYSLLPFTRTILA